MFIKSIEKEVTIADRTRKMTREINKELFKGVSVDVSVANAGDMDMNIPMENIEASNEITIKLLCWLSQEELDKLTDEEFTLLLDACTKKK